MPGAHMQTFNTITHHYHHHHQHQHPHMSPSPTFMHDVHDTDGVGALGGHRKRVPAERLHHEQTDERGGKNGLCVTLSWLTLTWVHLGTGFAQTLTAVLVETFTHMCGMCILLHHTSWFPSIQSLRTW